MDSPIYKEFDKESLPSNFVNIPIIPSFNPIEFTLPSAVCDSIIATMSTFGASSQYDVGVNGISENDYGKGSVRITNYDVDFAKSLTADLSPFIDPALKLNKYSPVDWQSQNEGEYNVWAFEGVSPVFRYMKYSKDSEHFPHYDAPFIIKEDPYIRTLMSGVLYLTTNKSGATAFVNDSQEQLPFSERNTSDWTSQATHEQILSWSLPQKGKIILFPHQACHTVLPLLEDEDRIIIRFDLFYTAIRRED